MRFLRDRPRRLAVVVSFAVVVSIAAFAAPAGATTFVGAADNWVGGATTVSISNGQLSALSLHTGRFRSCNGGGDPGSSADPVQLTYTGSPVALVNGAFTVSGTADDDWGQPVFSWTVSGQLSADGTEVSGIASASGSTQFDQNCVGSWYFDSIVPPNGPTSTFAEQNYHGTIARNQPQVSFRYQNGAVSHLTGGATATCTAAGLATTSGPDIDTSYYRQDPIRVDGHGNFSVTGLAGTGYPGVLAHFRVNGHIAGRKASGTLEVWFYYQTKDAAGTIAKCDHISHWSASTPLPPPPPGPNAYFQWDAVRVPAGAGYRFFFAISGLSCSHGATAVRLTVSGRTVTVSCSRRQAWASGPLAAGRTYSVAAQAVMTRHGRVIKHGPVLSERLTMPAPNDAGWRGTIGGLGPPPA